MIATNYFVAVWVKVLEGFVLKAKITQLNRIRMPVGLPYNLVVTIIFAMNVTYQSYALEHLFGLLPVDLSWTPAFFSRVFNLLLLMPTSKDILSIDHSLTV
jgi:hypothetical protein